MIDADLLRRRIDALLGYLELLERFKNIERDAFSADPDTHHLAERYLQLAVESALDIANHLIADADLEAPETYQDAFAILVRGNVLDAALGKQLQSWEGLRDVLVHDYLAIDHGPSWGAIQRDLSDLRAFAVVAAQQL